MIGTAIAVERIICLFFKYSVDADSLWGKISKAIAINNIESAKSFCRGHAAPIAGLRQGPSKPRQKRKGPANSRGRGVARGDTGHRQKGFHTSRCSPISRRFSDFLGTIQGLIQAFQAVGSADPTQKASILAGGIISIALYTTAFQDSWWRYRYSRLYSILQSKAHRLVDDIDEFSIKIINLLSKSIGDRRAHK